MNKINLELTMKNINQTINSKILQNIFIRGEIKCALFKYVLNKALKKPFLLIK